MAARLEADSRTEELQRRYDIVDGVNHRILRVNVGDEVAALMSRLSTGGRFCVSPVPHARFEFPCVREE